MSTDKNIIETDEIDLYELILILKKRINVIVITTLIGIMISVLYILFTPNIYQTRASLWVDTVSDIRIGKKFLNYLKKENLNIKDLSLIFPFLKKDQKPAYLNDLTLNILNTLNIRKKILSNLKISFHDSQEVLKEIEKIEKNLTPNNLNSIFRAEIGKNNNIILTSEQKDKKLGEEILRIALNEFEKEIKESSKSYMDSQSEDDFIIVKVLEEPISFDVPVKPKKTLILGVSTLSSFILGIFFAFIIEWWHSIKTKKEN